MQSCFEEWEKLPAKKKDESEPYIVRTWLKALAGLPTDLIGTVLDWIESEDGMLQEMKMTRPGKDLPTFSAREFFNLVDQRVSYVKKEVTYKYWLLVLQNITSTPATREKVKMAAGFDMFDLEHEKSMAFIRQMQPASASNKTKIPDKAANPRHFKLLQQFLFGKNTAFTKYPAVSLSS